MDTSNKQLIKINVEPGHLEGMLEVPENAIGLVAFAHGGGSNRLSPRNNYVAAQLRQAGIGTLLLDLLTKQENQIYATRFNISLLTKRLNAVCNWIEQNNAITKLPLGLFGASTGVAAVLQVAATHSKGIAAIVSRGGRPDLASQHALRSIHSPTLLIVGSHDESVLMLNQQAYSLIPGEKKLEIIPGATHLFEEPGALEKVSALAVAWFSKHMTKKV